MSGLDTFETQPYAVADLGGTKAESDPDEHKNLRAKAWKFEAEHLTLRCEDEKAPDGEACEQFATTMYEPGDWKDVVNQDLDASLEYFNRACKAGRQPACERAKQVEAEKTKK